MAVVIDNSNYRKMDCGQCGIVFYVPENFYDERINEGDGWHCPNGHSRQFTEPNVSKLERQLKEKEKELERVKSDRLTYKFGLENREKKLIALRKRLKKLKAGA